MPAARASARGRRLGWAALIAGIGLLAFVIRLEQLLRSGVLALGFYDDDVHFTAAVDLVHGRLPYRDVLFLQPPGMVLAASPFAALAGAVGDADAFAWARVAATVLGGVNAALVAVLLQRFGVPATLVGGVLYAASFPAVYVERTLAIEAPGTTAVLLALVLLRRAQDLEGGPGFVLAGVVAGSAVGLKIWYVVPVAVLVVAARGGRLRVLWGALLAGLAIIGPFFAAAPGRMWQEVVVAQLGRPDEVDAGPLVRLATMLGVRASGGSAKVPQLPVATVVVVLAVITVVVAVGALRDRRSRVFVVLLVATVVLLLTTPSYFQHYAALTAAPLALVGGAGAGRLLGGVPGRWSGIALALLVAGAALALGLPADRQPLGFAAPVAALRSAVDAIPGCVVADDPGALIVTGRLTPQVRRGCDVRPDPSGIGFVLPGPAGRDVERLRKPAFQRAILGYLHSGDAYVLLRGAGLQLSPATTAVLDRDPVLFRSGRFVLRKAPRR